LLRKLFDRPEQTHSIWTGEEIAQPRAEILLDVASHPSAHLMLRKKSHEVRIQVVPSSEVAIRLQTISSPDQHGTKAGIIWVKFLDINGLEVPSRGRISKGRQGHYIYITPDALGSVDLNLYVPHDCVEVVLGFALWKAYAGSLSLGNTVAVEHSVLPPFTEGPKADDEMRQQRISITRNFPANAQVAMGKDPLWLTVSTQDAKHLLLEGLINSPRRLGLRDAVALFRFVDKDGEEVGSLTEISRGPIGEYMYIVPDSSGRFSLRVHAPADCVSVSIGFAAWHAASGDLKLENALAITELTSDSANELRPGFGPPQVGPKEFRFDRLHEAGSSVPIKARARWARMPITHIKSPKLRVRFAVSPRIEGLSKKSALALVEFADRDGGRIAPTELSTSAEHGSYRYIDGRTSNEVSLDLSIPKNATEIRVGTMLWEAPKEQISTSNQIWVEAIEKPRPTHTPANTSAPRHAAGQISANNAVDSAGPKRAKQLKVALIADEFTYNCFKYEFTPIVIEPQNWRARFEDERPDLFLCESAWSGVDSQRRPWKGRVYTSSNFARENRTELLEILEWCKQKNVPTVFWNKEDPTHFEDKIHNFIDTAIRFDHVFTTDSTCVAGYKDIHGHPSVHCLPFATQPKLFNPIESVPRVPGVSFAGSWYANHLERSREMEIIFDQIIDADMELRIYDRFWGSDDELHHFPEKYRHVTRPAVPHSKIADAYKSTTLGLNINTVTSSPTMFARRIFELMSCNTLVVSNYSQGVSEFFGDRIRFAGQGYSDIDDLSEDAANAIRHAALHDVLAHHTYQRRFEEILDAIGFPYIKADSMVTLVCPVENETELKQAIARQAEFVDVAERLVIILGRSFKKRDAAYLQATYGRFGVVLVSWAWANDETLDPNTYIKGEVFALVSPDSNVNAKLIHEASLHRTYVDGPIVMGSDEKYQYVPTSVVQDIVAGPEFFQKAIKYYGQAISDNFYLV